MKRILTICAMAIMTIVAMAQTNPNRLIVVNKSGGQSGFVMDRIDSLMFRNVEGEVKADVEYLGYEKKTDGSDVIRCSVVRSESCVGFKILMQPKSMINPYNTEEKLANYVDKNVTTIYTQDFNNAELSGFDFTIQPNTMYSLVTVGVDQYGVACEVSRVDFTTPAADLVGNPSVEWTVVNKTKSNITLSITPNADCAGYYVCRFDAGTAEQQLAQWGAFMGFSNIGDMVKSWSRQMYTATALHEWNDCSPLTDYEVYILPVDANGAYGTMVIAAVTTEGQGGTGVAEVTITIGEFGGDEANGYWQKVLYTPNDQTLLFRDMIIEKSAYDAEWNENAILDYLKQDSPAMGWNQYEADDAQWSANPNTEYIAFAIAQNANQQWGPLARKEFSTPPAPGSVSKKTPIAQRLNIAKTVKGAVAPPLKQNNSVRLFEIK